jgi:hypothetical protein
MTPSSANAWRKETDVERGRSNAFQQRAASMVSSKPRGAAAVTIIIGSKLVTMHELISGIQTMPATTGWLSFI